MMHPGTHNHEPINRPKMVRMVLSTFLFWGPVFVVIYWMMGLWEMSLIVVAATLMVASTALYVYRSTSNPSSGLQSESLTGAGWLATTMGFSVVACMWLTGGLASPIISWLGVTVFIATVLGTVRLGIISILINLLCLLVIGVLDLMGTLPVTLMPEEFTDVLRLLAWGSSWAAAIGIVMAYDTFMRRDSEFRTHLSDQLVVLTEALGKESSPQEHLQIFWRVIGQPAGFEYFAERYLSGRLVDLVGASDTTWPCKLLAPPPRHKFSVMSNESAQVFFVSSWDGVSVWVHTKTAQSERWFLLSSPDSALPLGGRHNFLATAATVLQGALAEAEASIQQKKTTEVAKAMARLVAHEVRNPLQSLDALASLMAEEDQADERKTLKESIRTEIQALDLTVVRLLQDSGATGKIHAAKSSQSLTPLIQEIKGLNEPVASAGGVSLGVGALSDRPVPIDKVLMSRAVGNLLLNAIDAVVGLAVSEVSISTYEEGSFMVIQMDDSGPGVAEQIQSQIFNPGVTTRSGGLGLGLSFVQAVMKAHGGTIQYSPSELGGACFKARLPLADLQET